MRNVIKLLLGSRHSLSHNHRHRDLKGHQIWWMVRLLQLHGDVHVSFVVRSSFSSSVVSTNPPTFDLISFFVSPGGLLATTYTGP